jgi:polar amino acid transport system substrate-binding protein
MPVVRASERIVMKRVFLRWLLLTCVVLTACATPGVSPPPGPVVRELAPTGELRVGIYPGSPTSWVRLPDGSSAGVAHDLGTLLAQRLGVPVRLVEYPRVADIVDALQRQQVDVTFTNASAARARVVDFTAPLIRLELGVLVPPASAVRAFDQVDRNRVRVGVTQGSSSQTVLRQRFQQAQVVPMASLAAARQALQAGQLEAFATNKGILFELAEQLPGFRVLDDRWGFEHMALAIPQGRTQGLAFLQQWVNQELPVDTLPRLAARAGLRGLARD